ncbi:MAG TPA: T9SS type A sorting domain-containing protein [Cryomorphaceae bacterium]|nr:T9SS type A sorting domain-containing protein [Cryomorphaceae bacterium]
MKRSIYLMGTILAAALTVAAVPEKENDNEKIKVTVVHYADGHATVMDTSFYATSGYSVEQFLRDNNLDPTNAEIIDTDAFDGKYTIERGENSFLFMRDGEAESVRIEMHGFPDGIVTDDMGEDLRIEVEEMLSEELVEIEEMRIGEMMSEELEKDGFVKEVVVIRQDGEEQKTVIRKKTSGDDEIVEEVIFEEPDQVFFLEGGDESKIEVEQLLKEVEELLKREEFESEEIEWEEDVQVKVLREFETEESERAGADGKRKVIVHSVVKSNDPTEDISFEGPEYTIAVVSRVGGEEESDTDSFIADAAELPIEGPSFFPNPTEGKFRLEFFLPERGQTQIQIFDIQGREVFTENLGDFQGAFKNDIDISDLRQGAYILNITQNNLRLAEKIIVN